MDMTGFYRYAHILCNKAFKSPQSRVLFYARVFAIVALLFHVLSLHAQDEKFRFSNVDTKNGLSHNYVNTILKDESGFIWIGTMSGLNRYDGYKFRVFRHDPRDSSSLTDDFIDRIMEAPNHKLLVATRNGYNIYDPVTEKFDRDIRSYLKGLGILSDTVNDIIKDAAGNYWVLTGSAGVFKYSPSSGRTVCYKHRAADTSSLSGDDVTSMVQDSKSGYWLIHKGGIIEKMNEGDNKVALRTDILKKIYAHEIVSYRLFEDNQDDLWIYATGNTAKGVFCYNGQTGKLRHISANTAGAGHLNNNIVNGIAQDASGFIWIATDHGGINLINKKDFSVQYLLNREGDNQSIAQNTINVVYKDSSDNIWLGTYKKGVSCYQPGATRFPVYKHLFSDSSSLCYNDVNRFEEDKKGNLWIGTNGGGLIYFDRQKGTFRQFRHNPSVPNSLCNDVIVSLYMDHEQKLWIGTYYGGLDCFDGNIFKHYRHNENDSTSIGDDRIWALREDSRQRMWIGTFESGLDLFDRKTSIFRHFRTGDNSVHSSYITDIEEDRAGNIWLATSYGLDKIEAKTGNFVYYMHEDSNPGKTLSNNNVICIKEDSRGYLWVGTRVGLDLFDPVSGSFLAFKTEDGLPDNLILNILEDKKHNLWISTPAGLSNMILHTDTQTGKMAVSFNNYDESDGLQGRAFNEKAAFSTRDGEMVFGGPDGFNIFNPANIHKDNKNPALVLTELQVFNKTVPAGAKLDGHVILNESITEAKEITLRYNENIFSVEFAALNFTGSGKIKYEYKLEGFNKQWLTADNKIRKATFTNLDPADYILKIRASNSDGVWSSKEASIAIKILPPFWKTGWAYLLYFLLAASLLFLARHLVLQRANMRFAIVQERREAQRLHDLDLMKIRFFTNVSHEFRTPLSLILTPLDKIIKNAADISQKHQFQMIHRNARRLLNLVNQLLDFRKMEVQELKLCPQPGNIIKFIKDISYSFTDLAEKNNIKFSFTSAVEQFFTQFDHDKIERILFNLLSNAFKFTPENGKVNVEVSILKSSEEKLLQIHVCDTGIGIDTDKHENIFERFFQSDVPSNIINQGSGIGLAITREFVKLHNGTVNVESAVNKGSRFIVSLPLKETDENIEISDDEDDFINTADIEELETFLSDNTLTESVLNTFPFNKNGVGKNVKKPTVLLVEDSEDLRFYLKDNLKQYFNIVEAPNGKIGWQKALATHPGLIVSDVTMPEMNGIDLCKKLKNDTRTSFIPVILLTALTGEEKQLKGLETGANDYLTKPFNFEILLSKIRNLLAQQEMAKQVYQKHIKTDPAEIQVVSPDEKFMKQALEIVENNIANADLSVEELSKQMFISRVALYKKILALTGKTPLEFIRSIRLKRAAQLLEKSDFSVSEVAYQVGFNNPKYFSRFFKSEFNSLPSVYQVEKRKEQAGKNVFESEPE